MRRKPSVLLPLEMAILDAGIELQAQGRDHFHGFQLAKDIRERAGSRRLTAYGTLYKALGRLERTGLLESRWEDPLVAAEMGRPRRRFYHVTPAGVQALEDARPLPGEPRQAAREAIP